MQFNSHATDQDIVSEVLQICGATVAEYPLNDITRRFNSALDDYLAIAFDTDGRWNFDDINETSPPIDTQNIVSGTNRYKLSAFAETILSLLKLEILDSSGNGLSLIPELFGNFEQSSGYESGRLSTVSDENFQSLYIDAPSGTPTHYTKYGDFIYLRPNPDYSLANALLAYFDRPASYIASTDTTKVPGVPVVHHNALCRMAALPFLVEKSLPQANGVARKIEQDKINIANFFSRRTGDVKRRMMVNQQNNR